MARPRGKPLRVGEILHRHAGISVVYNGSRGRTDVTEGHELKVTHNEAHDGSTETRVQVMLATSGALAIVKHPTRGWPIPGRDRVFRGAVDAGVDAFVRRRLGEDHEFERRYSDDEVERTQRVQHRQYRIRG